MHNYIFLAFLRSKKELLRQTTMLAYLQQPPLPYNNQPERINGFSGNSLEELVFRSYLENNAKGDKD
jgi:hypothetical protein